MLLVRTQIRHSPIHGIGLFADELIPAGTVIWEYTEQFDLLFEAESLASLSDHARFLVEKYSYFEEALGRLVLCGDDARFMNHADLPNADDLPGMLTVAASDIAPGEEITCDYNKLGKLPHEVPGHGETGRVAFASNGAHLPGAHKA